MAYDIKISSIYYFVSFYRIIFEILFTVDGIIITIIEFSNQLPIILAVRNT